MYYSGFPRGFHLGLGLGISGFRVCQQLTKVEHFEKIRLEFDVVDTNYHKDIQCLRVIAYAGLGPWLFNPLA